MRATLVLLSILTASAVAQTPEQLALLKASRDRDIVPVGESDARWDIVKTEIDRITRIDPASPSANRLDGFGRLDGNASRALFPSWRFYTFSYSNYRREGFESAAVHLAGGLGHTLAVSDDPSKTVRLHYHGNYEDYGDLLTKNKISIRDAKDARLVWDAFNEIHRKGWSGYELKSVSDIEWWLGIYSYDQTISVVDGKKTVVRRTHYMKVMTDPGTGQIRKWESIVETSNGRVEREQKP